MSRFRSWPITEARALEPTLREMGLRVHADEIDGTGGGRGAGQCLSDALVSVGPAGRGGTGSFISGDGLIITNHHVAADAVRQASTTGADYLNDGFVARSRDEEIRGPDYEVWITRSCLDVSEQLEASRAEADPLKRANLVRDRRQEIAREAEAAAVGAAKSVRCEVQEMWPDRTYVLFTYERLRDVRIVYVPPMALGCFGGDEDNFEWPRHTADFTLLRAYVAPDGSAAEPSAENVPYHPSRYLRASTSGVTEGDFVFLLGFPGSTMRYAPSCRLRFADTVAVPELLSDFGEKLRLIAEHTPDRASALKVASAKKSLANEQKRSKGKRLMMRKLRLADERAAEEAALIDAAPEAKPLLNRLEEIYEELRQEAPRSAALDGLRGIYHGSALLAVSHAVHEGGVEAKKADGEREAGYRSRNLPFLVKRLGKRLKDMHPPLEAALITRAARRAISCEGLADGKTLLEVAPSLRQIEAAADALAAGSMPPTADLDEASIEAALSGGATDDQGSRPPVTEDVFSRVASELYPAYVASRDKQTALLSERDQLLASLLELQRKHSSEAFYPDANGCLRLSAGHVEGYKAADAVSHSPVTTIAGLVDKHEEASLTRRDDDDGADEFACPSRLLAACASDDAVGRTPVNTLYSTDTVGGNSGSPVLDADGKFVAINFDRQRLGLMNEYKWSAEYSRSIGVDVRYILWLVGTYDGAPYLVEEMSAPDANSWKHEDALAKHYCPGIPKPVL